MYPIFDIIFFIQFNIFIKRIIESNFCLPFPILQSHSIFTQFHYVNEVGIWYGGKLIQLTENIYK